MNQNWHKYPTYLEGKQMNFEPEREVKIRPIQKHDRLNGYVQTYADFKVLTSMLVAGALIYGCAYFGNKVHHNGVIDKQRHSITNNLENIAREK